MHRCPGSNMQYLVRRRIAAGILGITARAESSIVSHLVIARSTALTNRSSLVMGATSVPANFVITRYCAEVMQIDNEEMALVGSGAEGEIFHYDLVNGTVGCSMLCRTAAGISSRHYCECPPGDTPARKSMLETTNGLATILQNSSR